MLTIGRMGSVIGLLMAVFTGCGGGGGSYGNPESADSAPVGLELPENRVLAGEYELVEMTFAGGVPSSLLGKITFDEQGGYSMAGYYSSPGAGANLEISETGEYLVSDQGEFVLNGSDDIVLSGTIIYSGDLFFYSNVSAAGEQTVGIGLKTLGSGHSNSSLSGKYRLADFSFNENRACSLLADIDFDGSGGYSLAGRYSRTGEAANEPVTGEGSYAVQVDGTGFSLNPSGEAVLHGAISVRNNLFIYAKVSEEAEQSVGVGIKEAGSGHSDASLSGDYELIDFSSDGVRAVSSLATVRFDGIGGYTMTGRFSLSGEAADQLFEDSGTYSVSGDGSLVFTPSAGPLHNGVISAAGDLFIYSRITDPGEQSIGVAVRK